MPPRHRCAHRVACNIISGNEDIKLGKGAQHADPALESACNGTLAKRPRQLS